MDVSVLHKRAQRSPRPSLLVRLLGAGMLERARATSLALLGATAAVGLAIVAFALNQGWPLLEGSAIPAAPRQEVGRASVVARPAPASRLHTATAADRGQVGRRAHRSAGSSAARPHAAAVTPSGGESGRARRLRAGAGEVPGRRAEAEDSRPRTARRPAALRSRLSLRRSIARRTHHRPAAPAPSRARSRSSADPAGSGRLGSPAGRIERPLVEPRRGHAYGRGESRHDDGDHGWDHGDDAHDHGYGD